jgi:orotate phosphoribosyltransferase
VAEVDARTQTVLDAMDGSDVLEIFRSCGALLEGHFRLSSGLHSAGYLQSALVLQYPDRASRLGQALAARTRDLRATVVLSPALGGIVIGQEVARALGVRSVFVERQDGPMALRRGFTLAPTDRVLVVEDVVTTGGSTRETIAVATAQGAQVVGAASIIDRGASTDLGLPYVALVQVHLATYEPAQCPMCLAGTPLSKPGSRPL